MKNRIRDVVVVNHRLDPVETELYVHVLVASLTPTTEVKGRLTGPHCAVSSTIEIAYPLRELERGDHVVLRVVIPEPSWWEPETPFLYTGPLELWQDGQLCERVQINHGIRWLQLTPKGLRLNGKPFTLRGKIIDASWSDADAMKVRAAGFNTVLTALTEPNTTAWTAADRAGFFVIGSSKDHGVFLQCRIDLTSHPSTFGWLFNRADLANAPAQQPGLAMFYGVNTSARSRPANADFLVCLESELAWLNDAELPKIVIVKRLPDPLPARADVIGWIEAAL